VASALAENPLLPHFIQNFSFTVSSFHAFIYILMLKAILLFSFTFLLCLKAKSEEPTLPPEAKALLSAEEPIVPTKPKEYEGTLTKTADGWRVESPRKLEKNYNLALTKRFQGELAEGQVCLAIIKARTVSSEKPDGTGRIFFAIQNTTDYSKTPLWKGWSIGKEWETSFFTFTTEHPLPAGTGITKVIVGEMKQVIEIADFQVYAFPIGFDIFKAPRMKTTYGGRELDAPWRKDAAARIAKHRQGKLTIRVVDAEGKPVQGAKVKVAMQRHLFGFGSAVDVGLLSGLGTTFSQEDQNKYRNTVDELFSRLVPENGQRPRNCFAPLDPARPWDETSRRRTRTAVQWTLQWAQDRKMTSRGHYLVWGYVEPWARTELDKGGTVGLLDAYNRHFDTMIPFCADYVSEWDAINHPVPFNEADALYNIIGPDFYPDIYRKIRPLTDKVLFVNEDTFNPDRTASFEKHIQHMIAKGVTPDGCGFQSHFSDYAIPSIEEEWAIYERFGAMVKHLTVTEYDLQTLDDQLHADHLRDMITLCFSHPQMTGFVMWGFWEGRHWKPTAAMFKKDWTERPAVKVWRDLVKGEWWTNEELSTDAKGEAPLTAFYGHYEVTAEKDGKTATLQPKHATNGSKPTVMLK
jgi:endo-1,4-beta-xylanase